MNEEVLVYDIETTGVDIKKDKMVFFGAYSYKTNEYYYLNAYDKHQRHQIQKLIQNHKVLVGFNSNYFDKPIIENSGISWNTGSNKNNIDLLQVLTIKKRAAIMAAPCGEMLSNIVKDYKLKTIAEALEFKTSKGDIDYNIFKQRSFTLEELKEIYKYLKADIDLTKSLWEYIIKYFEFFKEFVSHLEYKKYKHITTTPGSFAYHAICYLTNTPLVWSDIKENPINNGGYVLEPQKEFAENVVYFDFSSLYPMIFIQNNLFSSTCKCCKITERMKKTNLFELQGNYCTKKQGKIEKLLKSLYIKRKKYKDNNDPRQYAIKIIINSLYGITGNSIFQSIYNYNLSGDCTTIGRAYIKKAIDIFNSKGFPVIYADTDSCFIQLGDKTLTEAESVADSIVTELQKYMPFPFKEFKLKIDGEFKKIRFECKKHYIGITNKNDIKITGMSIIRRDKSLLGSLIFEELKEDLIKSDKLQLPEKVFTDAISAKIKEDISVCQINFKVNNPESYTNTTSIQYQIAKEFGEGEFNLIPNKKIGRVGVGKKYCTIKQAKLFLNPDDLYLDKTINELKPFFS